ncbi:MAG: glycosyltransferase family 2 protein [Thiotrichaceae bacterium]
MIPPKVSVIIPCFNREHSIRKCVDSVLEQTFGEFEIILVNDGSTDGTRDIVECYSDPRVKIISSTQNYGPSHARNIGVEAAKGEWLAFLDSDDKWYRDKLARQLGFHSQQGSSGVGSCTGYSISRSGECGQKKMIPSPWKIADTAAYWICDVCPGSTLMVPRAIFKDIGPFDESLRRLEDREWLIRYSAKYSLAIVPKVLAAIYPSGYGGSEDVVLASAKLLILASPGVMRSHFSNRRRLVASLEVEIAASYFGEGHHLLGLGHLLHGVLRSPFKVIQLLLGRFTRQFHSAV